jgi:hypothetical protein
MRAKNSKNLIFVVFGEFAVFHETDQQLYKQEPNKADHGASRISFSMFLKFCLMRVK